MNAAIWPGDNRVTLLICLGLGLVAGIFFIIVFIADREDAKRRAAVKRAIRRMNKKFSGAGAPARQETHPSAGALKAQS